ncbi:hypothetical protein [Nostoc sp. NIES-3756]|uniref:hypothetical protein n=1 Tax=Nostoc sp. NIES-3756 TaxID=1751286 RepID=UPI000B256C69|nr:hypothetical protein [Nostoc sp. NIES-3756]
MKPTWLLGDSWLDAVRRCSKRSPTGLRWSAIATYAPIPERISIRRVGKTIALLGLLEKHL